MRHPVTGIVVATLIVSVLQKSLKREWEEAERVREESAEFLPGHGFSGDLSFALSPSAFFEFAAGRLKPSVILYLLPEIFDPLPGMSRC